MNIEQHNVLSMKVITNYGGFFLDKLGVHLDQILTLKTNITLLPSHSKNLSLFFSSKTK
jgi:hypothetical protein